MAPKKNQGAPTNAQKLKPPPGLYLSIFGGAAVEIGAKRKRPDPEQQEQEHVEQDQPSGEEEEQQEQPQDEHQQAQQEEQQQQQGGSAEGGEELVEELVERSLWRRTTMMGSSPRRRRRRISAWIKLAQISHVSIGGGVQVEQLFSYLTFIKDDLRSCLKPAHLNVCLRIYHTAHHYKELAKFPYMRAFVKWLAKRSRRAAERSIADV
jgi:hypothetical protein